MDITGTLPSIIYNEIPHEKFTGLYPGGSDIDINITGRGGMTGLSAITLGNGRWEIDGLDDGLDLLPEYDEGDVVGKDVVVKMILSVSAVSQSRHIFSFNALGKAKYGIKDTVGKIGDKLGKAKRWLTDEITPEIAQDFLQKSYPGARIGKIDEYSSKDGGIYKVLFGVPSEKKYYVMCLQRNGNKIRELDDDDYDETPIYSFTDGDTAMKYYNQYPSDEGLNGAGEGITEEELKNALADSPLSYCSILDWENIKDKGHWIDNLPTAIAVTAGTDNDIIYVGWESFTKGKDGVEPVDGRQLEIASEEDVKPTVKSVIDDYKRHGGTKDLSYLLQENMVEEAEENPTSGEDGGVQWEIKQSAKRKRKSRFWGKNVTGYEDGSLGEMVCEAAILNELVPLNEIPENSQLDIFMRTITGLGYEIESFGKVTRQIWDAYIKFRKRNAPENHGILFLENAVHEGHPGHYKWSMSFNGTCRNGEGTGSNTLTLP